MDVIVCSLVAPIAIVIVALFVTPFVMVLVVRTWRRCFDSGTCGSACRGSWAERHLLGCAIARDGEMLSCHPERRPGDGFAGHRNCEGNWKAPVYYY